jgi:uncharacterized membrane protein YeiB
MLSHSQRVWRWVLLTLVGLGLIHLLLTRTTTTLIMFTVLGLIVYLYKRPPQWLIRLSDPLSGPRGTASRMSSAHKRKQKKTPKKKKYPFRVINGNKKDLRIKKTQ